jgi:hypothetical protein
MALDLLKNADLRGAIVAESEQRALEHISFQAVRSQLAKFFCPVRSRGTLTDKSLSRPGAQG